MSDADDRTWLLTPITGRTTKEQLLKIVHKMPAKYRTIGTPGDYSLPNRKADLAKFIKERRQLHWQEAQKVARPAPHTPSRHGAGRGKVVSSPHRRTAADECNAFLRSLPPVPPFGFEDEH